MRRDEGKEGKGKKRWIEGGVGGMVGRVEGEGKEGRRGS